MAKGQYMAGGSRFSTGRLLAIEDFTFYHAWITQYIAGAMHG